ncbi:MAG: class I SAM-dependent methyltransferase [Gemmatimonadetes bacterium]|nr:class I SAM-dependent methyltransferase [Gemmatimonadota bacterium]
MNAGGTVVLKLNGGRASDYAYLWRHYGAVSLSDRLFVLVRRACCPWGCVVDALPARGRILDVGSGRGILAALIQRDRPQIDYVGVDLAESVIRVARASAVSERCAFHLLTDELWTELGAFDCVTLVDVLYAVPLQGWAALLGRCVERLKPGGLLVAKETVSRPAWKRLLVTAQERLAIQVLRYTKGEPPHFEPPETYLEAFRASGLNVLSHHPVHPGHPYPHYLFLARRGHNRSL